MQDSHLLIPVMCSHGATEQRPQRMRPSDCIVGSSQDSRGFDGFLYMSKETLFDTGKFLGFTKASEQVELMHCVSKDYRWIYVTHMRNDKCVSPLLTITMISVVLMWIVWNMDLRLMCLVNSSFLLNLNSVSCGNVVPFGWLFQSVMAKLLKTLLVEEHRVALGSWQGTAKQRKWVQCRLRSMRFNLASH